MRLAVACGEPAFVSRTGVRSLRLAHPDNDEHKEALWDYGPAGELSDLGIEPDTSGRPPKSGVGGIARPLEVEGGVR